MKEFIIEAKHRKAICELTIWNKSDEIGTYTVEHELHWRSGSFSILVPETQTEKEEFAKRHSISLDDIETHQFLPNADAEEINLSEFDADLIETNDGVYQSFSLTSYPDDADADLISEIEAGIEEDGTEYLEENDWDEIEYSINIEGGVVITPV